MKPEIKKLWVDALRSGEYDQGNWSLRFGDKFCCLGVLCDLHAKELGFTWEAMPRCGSMNRYLKSYLYLPDEVMEWAGLDSRNPHVGSNTIGYLNDVGESFSKIAYLIEQHL